MNLKYFRKAILLIHGFAGGNYDYGKIGNDLELYNNFDVYTFTLPGHEKMVISKVTRDDWINKAEEVLSRFFKIPIPTIREFMLLVEEHTGDVKNITCPTLIIHGDKDDIVPKDSVLYVYDNISSKSVTLVEIKTLTHDLFINNRYEEVKELITIFLRKKPKFGKYTKKI